MDRWAILVDHKVYCFCEDGESAAIAQAERITDVIRSGRVTAGALLNTRRVEAVRYVYEWEKE